MKLPFFPSRWNDFQDEHDEVLEQLESFRTTFALSNTTTNTNNCGGSNSPPPVTTDGVTEGTVSTFPGSAKSSTPEPIDANLRSSTPINPPRQQEQQERATGGGEEDMPRGFGGMSEDVSKAARPISGREGRSRGSSSAPPRPASGRNRVARSSNNSITYEDGGAVDCGNRSRSQNWGSPREDGLSKPGSNPSSRRSSPRRPPSSGSSVPSPRYCSSPRTSGAGATAAAPDAAGLRRRRSTEEWGGVEGWDRTRAGCDEAGTNDEKENQARLRGDADDRAIGTTAAAATAVSAPLHGGDSGGYEDDFDDCFEDDSEEGGQLKEQEGLAAGGSNGGGGSDKATLARNTPLVEVVYRPPSGGSRGKGERPKSAARQGRSASLNGAG